MSDLDHSLQTERAIEKLVNRLRLERQNNNIKLVSCTPIPVSKNTIGDWGGDPENRGQKGQKRAEIFLSSIQAFLYLPFPLFAFRADGIPDHNKRIKELNSM
jgi:hypothetical protein